MRIRIPGLLLAALIPLVACDTDTGEMGRTGADEELQTQPAAETPSMEEPVTEEVGFAEWDTDADQQLAREEWDSWYRQEGLYDQWNTDAEDGLTSAELADGAILIWDADDDGALTEDEWSQGVGTWFADEDHGAWDEWDANGDGVLDANEVAEGLETRNLYDRVDRDSDALIDDEELADWWFDIWDANDDDHIDTTEWDQLGTEWSRAGSGM